MEPFAIFTNASELKKIIDAIGDIVQDANIFVDESGIHMQAMDPSHVAVCYFVFPPESLEYFDNTQRCIGMNMKLLQRILHCIKDDNKIILSIVSNGDKLGIKSESYLNEHEINVEIPLINLNTEIMEIPEMTYSVRASIDSKEFSKIVKDLISLGSVTEIQGQNNILKFITNSDEGVMMDIKLFTETNEKIDIQYTSDVDISVSSSYLRQFVKGCALVSVMCIELTNDLPIKISYNLDNGTKLVFMCAPKDVDL